VKTLVTLGQQWRRHGDVATWVVVGIDAHDGVVCLSGPVPARSIIYLTIDDLESEWSVVDM
jgi:hypothetical protein